jgi:hypothetical protein
MGRPRQTTDWFSSSARDARPEVGLSDAVRIRYEGESLRREVRKHFVDEAPDTLVPFLGGQSRINLSRRRAALDQFL